MLPLTKISLGFRDLGPEGQQALLPALAHCMRERLLKPRRSSASGCAAAAAAALLLKVGASTKVQDANLSLDVTEAFALLAEDDGIHEGCVGLR